MSSTEPERQKLSAALEQLEAEQKRRIAEKVASGELTRVVLPPTVVSSAEEAAEVIAAREALTAAKLREGVHLEPMAFPSCEGDNSEPITVIVTGVPRNRKPDPWHEPAEPDPAPPSPIPDRYAADKAWYAARAAARKEDGSTEAPAPAYAESRRKE